MRLLKQLKQNGYLLGIITDSFVPVYLKLSWFDKGGFADVWDSYISSQEIGAQKPDPRMYLAALEQIGLEPNQSVFVGHNPDELNGAKKIGMVTIAFNSDQGAVADHTIEQFQDLLTVQLTKIPHRKSYHEFEPDKSNFLRCRSDTSQNNSSTRYTTILA